MSGAEADTFEPAQGPPKKPYPAVLYASVGEKNGQVLVRAPDVEKPVISVV
jgi:hypothetical protein